MSKNVYQKLEVEFVGLLGKAELKEAQDFWLEKLDYLIDFGSTKEVENAENILNEIDWCIRK